MDLVVADFLFADFLFALTSKSVVMIEMQGLDLIIFFAQFSDFPLRSVLF